MYLLQGDAPGNHKGDWTHTWMAGQGDAPGEHKGDLRIYWVVSRDDLLED